MSIELEKGVTTYYKSKQGDEYFTINGKKTNFQIKEFACKDGSDLIKIDDELVEKLQILRFYFASPIIINSGYRTVAYNKQVGGVDNSQHVLGKACDIVIKGHSSEEVGTIAKKIGFMGVGIYSAFVHVDTRSTPSYWRG
jgi:uncharacterized protein YcbK (DUF882 family)